MSVTAIQIDDRLSLFADPLRGRIIGLLAREQLCTCHLMQETGAKQTTVSHHLKLLREAGLVESEPHGRFTYYRLRPEMLDELTQHLGEISRLARTAADLRRPC